MTDKTIAERIEALSAGDQARVLTLLTHLEQPRKAAEPTEPAGPFAEYQTPQRVEGSHRLAAWKRPYLARGRGRLLYQLHPSITKELTWVEDWPLDRMVCNMTVTTIYSSTQLDTPRAAPVKAGPDYPHADLMQQLAARSAAFKRVTGDPLGVIPQSRAHQSALNYQFMEICPQQGLRAEPTEYPISGERRYPAVNVTKLRQCLILLGKSPVLWAVQDKYLLLRTPYMITILTLTKP